MGHHLKTNLTSYRRNRKARQKAKKLAPPPLESSEADSNASNEVTETSIEKTPQTSPKTYSASSPAPDKSTCNSSKGSKPCVFYQYETDPLYLKFCEYNLLDYRLNKVSFPQGLCLCAWKCILTTSEYFGRVGLLTKICW